MFAGAYLKLKVGYKLGQCGDHWLFERLKREIQVSDLKIDTTVAPLIPEPGLI